MEIGCVFSAATIGITKMKTLSATAFLIKDKHSIPEGKPNLEILK